MGSEWPKVRLGDCVDSCLGKMLDKEKNRGELFPYLGNKNVRWGSFATNELAQMRFEEHEHERYGLRYGDLVVCEGGEPGRCAIWKDEIPGMKIQKALHRIRAKKNVDNRFLHYWFLTSSRNGTLEPHITGTTIKHLTGKNIAQLEIFLPPLETQKAIAHILGSLDDKIELNRQMNATLEAIAQALFKSWFVDFDPVIDNALAAGNPIPEPLQARAEARKALGDKRKPLPEAIQQQFPSAFEYSDELGWIPEGWRVNKLNSLLDIRYGKDHKNLDDGKIPVYGSGGIMRFAEKHLYEGEAILIPRKGSLNNLVYLNTKFWCVDTIFYGVPQAVELGHYLYLTLKQYDLVAMNVGSAVPSMTTKVLNDLDFLVPTSLTLSSFNESLEEFRKAQNSFSLNNDSLTRLRDTLLPKLLSGQLRIPEAEKRVAEAI
ncbi:MAG: type I restriction enzyme, S subunit [Phormidesmis priestleyi Ana]|uniref:Type I restriction enzyme, S subunit n=1 Tax=Phormidesmis priestleyi Ana TaxID=1666911 RepID=A0A0N8KM41_9CYAN|nr:MAG: type I restriction enzyme, S subunit [Phormidesmis priestleyi Ana]